MFGLFSIVCNFDIKICRCGIRLAGRHIVHVGITFLNPTYYIDCEVEGYDGETKDNMEVGS